jgi:transposase-like protein
MKSNLSVIGSKNKRKKLQPIRIEEAAANEFVLPDGSRIDTEHELLSYLLPENVKAFYRELSLSVDALCGGRYRHSDEACTRWGKQPGSIVLGNQRIAVERPRVRSTETGKEVEIPFYEKMQSPESFDRAAFQSALKKCSQRDYKNGIPELAASFGMSKSTVSRSWVRTTGKKLDEFMSRDFSATPIVAVLLDGKRFHEVGCLIAMGIDLHGKKHILGVYECSTENAESCKSLLSDLESRGLPDRDLLFVVDGGSGLNKALREKYDVHRDDDRRAVVVRCFVHKWENLKSALSPEQQIEAKSLYWAVRDARDVSQAVACSDQLKALLRRTNGSALRSYQEAENELLNLHRLKLAGNLKKFFSSTNPIESLNSLLEEDMRRVKRWRDSTHFRRWVATMALKNESRMKRVRGHNGMEALNVRIQELCRLEKIDAGKSAA